MQPAELAAELERRHALQSGHFRLSSGRHSDRFIQKFRLLEDPRLVEPIARALAEKASPYRPQVVLSAAVGGIVLGYEVARQFGTLALFVEKEGGVPALRRGFSLAPGERVLVVEDVVTTGRSVREVIDVVRSHGAEVVLVAVVVRRAPVDFGVPSVALLDLPVESYDAASCPQCARGEAIVEPGSRFVKG